MCSLTVSLYEFGLFLQILLWIFVPVCVIAILVTTYLHYRQKRKLKEEAGDMVPSFVKDIWVGELTESDYTEDVEAQEGRNRVYRGLLWMKEKYEQYREQADKRYEQMKDDLRKSEEKYEELLAARQRDEASVRTLTNNRPNLTEGAVLAEESVLAEEAVSAEEIVSTGGHALSEEAIRGEIVVVRESALNGKALNGRESKVRNGQDKKIMNGQENKVVNGQENNVINGQELIFSPARGFISEEAVGELIAEKDKQIEFLQAQLDQRIKNYYLVEYQGREERARLEELQEYYLQAQQLLEDKQQVLDDRLQLLNEQQVTIDQLHEQLRQETCRTVELMNKLESDGRLILSIYKELDRSLRIEKRVPVPGMEAQEPEPVVA